MCCAGPCRLAAPRTPSHPTRSKPAAVQAGQGGTSGCQVPEALAHSAPAASDQTHPTPPWPLPPTHPPPRPPPHTRTAYFEPPIKELQAGQLTPTAIDLRAGCAQCVQLAGRSVHAFCLHRPHPSPMSGGAGRRPTYVRGVVCPPVDGHRLRAACPPAPTTVPLFVALRTWQTSGRPLPVLATGLTTSPGAWPPPPAAGAAPPLAVGELPADLAEAWRREGDQE